MNNKKHPDDDSTDVDINIDKKDKNNTFWKKVTGVWDLKKNQLPPAKLPLPSSQDDNTSRTVSSNHTLQGKIKNHDLSQKGHNFDTTEVEMGKLALHKVSPSNNLDKPNNFSNIDNATLTGLRVDMKKSPIWDEITRTKLNIFSALRNMKNSNEDETESKIAASTNTRLHNPDGTVLMAMPKTSKWKDVAKLLGLVIIIGAAILAILYGISYWSTKKEEVQKSSGENIVNTHKTESSTDNGSKDGKAMNEIVNYQAVGRGLIYNCKGKHWACVDKANYLKCKKLSNSGSKDCVTKKVLKSNDSCFEIQRKLITKNSNTDFCN